MDRKQGLRIGTVAALLLTMTFLARDRFRTSPAPVEASATATSASTQTDVTTNDDGCKFTPKGKLGKVGDVEVHVERVDCPGETDPRYLVSLHSPRISEDDSEDGAIQAIPSSCENFADSLYLKDDVVLGCCPTPAPAGSGEARETVLLAKVLPAKGKFDRTEFAEFINMTDDEEGPSTSCREKNLEFDYEAVTR